MYDLSSNNISYITAGKLDVVILNGLRSNQRQGEKWWNVPDVTEVPLWRSILPCSGGG